MPLEDHKISYRGAVRRVKAVSRKKQSEARKDRKRNKETSSFRVFHHRALLAVLRNKREREIVASRERAIAVTVILPGKRCTSRGEARAEMKRNAHTTPANYETIMRLDLLCGKTPTAPRPGHK